MDKVINLLFEKEQILLDKLNDNNYFERDIKIVDFKIVWFIWLRWVWKTTFLLQERNQKVDSLYISMDDLSLKNTDIFELIKEISKAYSIKTFYLDEIQFLNNWKNILKNIYDILDVKIVFTGSSMIDLVKWSIDLSRRVIISKIDIFSFLEYEKFYWNNLNKISLNDLFENTFEISKNNSSKVSLIRFSKYLDFWQFGYFFEYKNEIIFRKLLQNSIKKSIYEDLVKFIDIHTTNISKIEDLVVLIASSSSSEITINSLSNKLWLNHITVSQYLEFLEKLWWVISINKFWSVSESIRKEKKFYLTTTNLLSIFSSSLLDISNFKWNLRETFVISNLHKVKDEYNFEIFFKSRTDIVLVFNDWKKIELEIWWKNKLRQDVLVINDDTLIWKENNIPLRMFWILY